MFKKLLIAAIVATVPFLHSFDQTSQTFFMPRSLSMDVIQEHALTTFRIHHADYKNKDYKRPKKKMAFNAQLTLLGSESTSGDDLAEYFLIGGKTTLVVDEAGNGDIGSGWLGVEGGGNTLFNGSFSISPKRSVFGALLNNHFDLSSTIDGAWITTLIPIVHVRHTLHFKETDGTSNFSASSFTSIASALDNPEWHYGKWSSTPLTKSGIDDVMAKIGYELLHSDRARIDAFLSFLIPLGDKPLNEFIFEPMVGMGGHFGFGGGFMFQADIIKEAQQTLNILLDLHYRYLFSGTEKRSFDIKHKPWSRYLIFQRDNTQQAQLVQFLLPGINFLSKDVEVTPRSFFDLLTSLHYRYSLFNIEAGYRFWWKEGEKVELENAFNDSISISSPAIGIYLPGSTINDAFGLPSQGENSNFVAITKDDLDLSSAAHKTAISNTIYMAISVNGQVGDNPGMLGIGGSYEFANRNTALDMWSLWGTVSIGF